MRLALISYEYPPAVAVGGIGTYALEAAKMLAKGGVDVEVFSVGPEGTMACESSGVPVHRVLARERGEFSDRIAPIVIRQHRLRPFNLLESPEIGAEGAVVAAALPESARKARRAFALENLDKAGTPDDLWEGIFPFREWPGGARLLACRRRIHEWFTNI